jgi:carbonic anhydrase
MDDSSLSRRGLIGAGAAAAGAAALTGDAAASPAGSAALTAPRTPRAALRLLLAGNRRWQRGQLHLRSYSPVAERHEEAQKPFAAILTCADSRISTTLIFDLFHGNVFVARIAGNTLDPEMLGSIEYSVAVLGVKVVMVLGHSNCGAVDAALGVVKGTKTYPPEKYGHIGTFVDAVVPAVQSLPPERRTLDTAIAANASAQAAALAGSDPIVKPAVDSGALMVVAAVYDIGSGRVSLL